MQPPSFNPTAGRGQFPSAHSTSQNTQNSLIPAPSDFTLSPSQALLAGLAILTSAESGRFNAKTDIKKICLMENPATGELTGIKLTCTENPAWLERFIGIHGNVSNEVRGGEMGRDVFTIIFAPDQVEQLPYASLAPKFKSGSLNGLTVNHLAGLNDFDQILGNLMVNVNYEKRFTNFETKDGVLNSIVVKFALSPENMRAMLKTMDDFNATLIPFLAEKTLRINNFNRLVSYFGPARDGVTPCIELRASALAEGIHASQS